MFVLINELYSTTEEQCMIVEEDAMRKLSVCMASYIMIQIQN